MYKYYYYTDDKLIFAIGIPTYISFKLQTPLVIFLVHAYNCYVKLKPQTPKIRINFGVCNIFVYIHKKGRDYSITPICNVHAPGHMRGHKARSQLSRYLLPC